MILIEKTKQQYKKIIFVLENIDYIPEEIKQKEFDIIDIECAGFNNPIYDSINKKIIEYEEAYKEDIEKEKIKQELYSLDYIVNRQNEDLYCILTKKQLINESDVYIKTKDTILYKKELRKKLNSL